MSRTAHRATRTAVALALILLASLRAPAGARSAVASAPLAERISAIVDVPDFRAARWGVHVVALDTGEAVYSRDATRLFMPGSNMKLFSTSLALARLGPE